MSAVPGVRAVPRSRVAVVALVVAGLVVAVVVAAPWLRVLAVVGAVVVWAVWVTRPPEVRLGRHVAALAGHVVLDVVRAALRAVVGALVVAAIAWAAWSWAQPRITAQLGLWRHSAVTTAEQTARRAVTDATPDLGEWWAGLTGAGARISRNVGGDH